jgi:hypothetical protein
MDKTNFHQTFNQTRAKAMPITGDVLERLTNSVYDKTLIGIYRQISEQTSGVQNFVVDITSGVVLDRIVGVNHGR